MEKLELDVFSERMKNLPKKVRLITKKVIQKKSDEIVLLNKGNLVKGLNSDDSRIERKGVDHYPYSQMYLPMKRAVGGQTSVVDLKFQGDFYNSIDVVVKGGEIEIIATDNKTEELKDWYGEDILGVDADKLIAIIREDIVNMSQRYLLTGKI